MGPFHQSRQPWHLPLTIQFPSRHKDLLNLVNRPAVDDHSVPNLVLAEEQTRPTLGAEMSLERLTRVGRFVFEDFDMRSPVPQYVHIASLKPGVGLEGRPAVFAAVRAVAYDHHLGVSRHVKLDSFAEA